MTCRAQGVALGPEWKSCMGCHYGCEHRVNAAGHMQYRHVSVPASGSIVQFLPRSRHNRINFWLCGPCRHPRLHPQQGLVGTLGIPVRYSNLELVAAAIRHQDQDPESSIAVPWNGLRGITFERSSRACQERLISVAHSRPCLNQPSGASPLFLCAPNPLG